MNEEIREALKIIKEPITVNCIEYKYFDQENYDKITRVYDNCLWFANNLEQINLTVENLEKENQQLKLQYCERTDCSGRIGNSKKVEQLQQENEQLKSKLEQRDNIINKAKEFVYDYKKQWTLNDDVVDDMEVLLKILDNKGE